MDKLQAWLRRIQQPPRREVANLEYWFLLAETRIAQEAGISRITLGKWERGEKTPNSFDLYNVLKVLKWEPEDFWTELGKHFEPTAKPLRIAAERTKIKAYIEQTKKKR